MTDSTDMLIDRLSQLKRAFDDTFAAPVDARADEAEDVLAIELGGHPFALRVRELTGLYVERTITPIPSAPPELLGLAAVRGELVAVYDLAVLLGYGAGEPPRFVALGAAPALAFSFGKLEGHVRVARTSISPADRSREPWFAELVREADRTRPILELAAVSAALEDRLRRAAPKENDR